MQYLIMCRSLTAAQTSARVLERSGITASVIKAPQGLSTKGCAYALSLYRHFNEAVAILSKKNMLNGKLYRKNEDGVYQEV